MAIKVRLGKLKLTSRATTSVVEHVARNDFVAVSIEVRHVAALETLETHPGDPFDRLLIVQPLVLGVPIVNANASFRPYENKCIF